jgi:hypothetical protein
MSGGPCRQPTLPSRSRNDGRSKAKMGRTMYFPTRSASTFILARTRLWTLNPESPLLPLRQPLRREIRQGEGRPVDLGIEMAESAGDVECPHPARIDFVQEEVVAPHADRVGRHGPQIERRVAEYLLQEDTFPGVGIEMQHERAGLDGEDAARVELGLELL